MSKRLPYFQFEPAEYLTGDIMFCSLASQGLFNQICCLYWQKECELTLEQALKRLNNKDLFNELISEAIIKIQDEFIVIEFLDNQYVIASKKAVTNSENGKKGALNRWNKQSRNSHAIANAIAAPLKNDGESIALRQDNTIQNEIIQNETKQEEINKILLKKEPKIKPLENKVLEIILPFDSEEFKTAWTNWKHYRKVDKKKPYVTQISEGVALNKLKKDCLGRENIALEMIETSISAGWTGLFTPTKKQNYEPIATPEPKKQRTFQDMLDDKAKREGTYVSTEGDNEQFTDFDTVD
jgi:hypothetical protein